MSSSPTAASAALRCRARLASVALAAFVAMGLVATPAGAAATAIDLGTASSFAVLAGSGITNTGATTITGDVGTFPTPAMTGLNTVVLTGANHADDAVTQQAKVDLTTGYNQAAASGPPTLVATELGNTTLTPGVYQSGTLGITGTLTLDTQGNPDAVFVFQAASTLITASASTVVILGGATACNVFWQVGSSATLGSDSLLVGSVLAETSITANDGATIQGRLLARNGAVTLQHNTITTRTCAAITGAATPAVGTGGGAVPAAASSGSPTSAGTPRGSSTATATPVTTGTPSGGSITNVSRPDLPRTGLTDWLPLSGALAIALGLLLTRLAAPRAVEIHAATYRESRPLR
jgi:hypothetical protein